MCDTVSSLGYNRTCVGNELGVWEAMHYALPWANTRRRVMVRNRHGLWTSVLVVPIGWFSWRWNSTCGWCAAGWVMCLHVSKLACWYRTECSTTPNCAKFAILHCDTRDFELGVFVFLFHAFQVELPGTVKRKNCTSCVVAWNYCSRTARRIVHPSSRGAVFF